MTHSQRAPEKRDHPNRVAADVKTLLSRLQRHIAELETLMRMLDSDTVDIFKINDTNEDTPHYIESRQDSNRKEVVSLRGNLNMQHWQAS